MDPAFFPGQASTAKVIGALSGKGKGEGEELTWTSELNGVYAAPMTFDAKGRLRPVAVNGLRSRTPGKTKGCWNVTGSGTDIPLAGTLYRWPWTARLAYSGPAGRLTVRFGKDGIPSAVGLPAGRHLVYLPVTGSGSVLNAQFRGGTPLCVAVVTVGLVFPDQSGAAIPADPLKG
jgi:hypothetical protein